MRSSTAAARRCSSTTSGWSCASPRMRAITRRWPVIRRPFIRQARSIALAVRRPAGLLALSAVTTTPCSLGRDIRRRALGVHRASEAPAHGDGAGMGAVGPGVIALAAADLAEAAPAIEGEGGVVAFLDFEEHQTDPGLSEALEVPIEQRPRMASAARVRGERHGEDLRLVGGAPRDDEAGRLGAAPEKEPVRVDALLGERALELDRVPRPRERLGMNLGKPGGVACGEASDAGRRVAMKEPVREAHCRESPA